MRSTFAPVEGLQGEVHLCARGGNYVVLFGGGAGGENCGQGEDVYNVFMHRTFYMNWMQRYALFSIPACVDVKKQSLPLRRGSEKCIRLRLVGFVYVELECLILDVVIDSGIATPILTVVDTYIAAGARMN